MFNVIPPTGVPFGWDFVFHSDKTDQNSFKDELGRLLGGDVFLTCSGKAALYLVLKAARRIYPNRDEVIIPDYTCWSVPSVKPASSVYEPALPQVAATITISRSPAASGLVLIGSGVSVDVPLLSAEPKSAAWSTLSKNTLLYTT